MAGDLQQAKWEITCQLSVVLPIMFSFQQIDIVACQADGDRQEPILAHPAVTNK